MNHPKRTKLNIFLSIVLLAGITFSVITIALATAPDPGHNFTEVGGGVVQGNLLYGSAADTLAALPKDSNATRYLSNTGTSNNPAWAQVNLTNGVTGVLPDANIASALTGKTYNGLTLTPVGTGFTLAGGTVSKTLTVTGDATISGTPLSTAPNSLTSAQLSTALSDETGTGFSVFNTAPTFATSITNPLLIGGINSNSTLSLRSTSGTGAAGADIIFQTGANGATEAMRILNNGNVGIGAVTPTHKLEVAGDSTFSNTNSATALQVFGSTTLPVFQVSTVSASTTNSQQDTGIVVQGSAAGTNAVNSSAGATNISVQSPNANENLAIFAKGTGEVDLSGNVIRFQTGAISRLSVGASAITPNLAAANSAVTLRYPFPFASDAALTAATNAVEFQTNTIAVTRTHATGSVIPLQTDIVFGTTPHAFNGFSLANNIFTNIANVSVQYDTMGTNARATNSHALYIPTAVLNASTTNSYGLTVNASTGATNNYAAEFLGGNVGIGTTSPLAKLQIATFDDSVGPAIFLQQDNDPTSGWKFYVDTLVDGNLRLTGKNPGSETEVMAFNRSTGNVGIGTTSPITKLDFGTASANAGQVIDVYTNANRRAGIGMDNLSSGLRLFGSSIDPSAVALGTISNADGTTFSPKLTVTSAGNVGIGTSTPTYKFVVSNAGATGLEIDPTGVVLPTGVGIFAYDRTANLYKSIELGTPGQLELNSGGNVGVGTTTPLVKLDVLGSVGADPATVGTTPTGFFKLKPSNSSASLEMGISGTTAASWLQAHDVTSQATNYNLLLNPNGGGVGIGTAAIGGSIRLDVRNGGSVSGFPTIVQLTGTGIGTAQIQEDSALDLTIKNVSTGRMFLGTNNATQMTILSGGNVGIGTVGPSTDKLVVVGDIRVGTAGSNGCIENFAGTALTGACSSDINLKKNITPITGILDTFLKLTPITYQWRADEFPDRHFGSEVNKGLIAQDVEKLFPELVGVDGRGFKTVDYGVSMQMLSIEAIKELNQKVDALAANGPITQGANPTNLAPQTLTVGTPQNPSGITMYDKQGQPGCLEIDNVQSGAVSVTPGVCGTQTINVPAPASAPQSSGGPDTTAPVITLNGDATVNLNVGDTYAEPGASALDDVDGAVPVQITGSIGTTTGTYTILYNARDAAGNNAAEVVRTVNVGLAAPGLPETGLVEGTNNPWYGVFLLCFLALIGTAWAIFHERHVSK